MSDWFKKFKATPFYPIFNGICAFVFIASVGFVSLVYADVRENTSCREKSKERSIHIDARLIRIEDKLDDLIKGEIKKYEHNNKSSKTEMRLLGENRQ